MHSDTCDQDRIVSIRAIAQVPIPERPDPQDKGRTKKLKSVNMETQERIRAERTAKRLKEENDRTDKASMNQLKGFETEDRVRSEQAIKTKEVE